MRKSSTHLKISSIVLLPCALLAAAPQTPAPQAISIFVPAQKVLIHLEQTIGWYRHVNALEASPSSTSDVLLRDNTHQLALHGLQLAFDFAKADAALRAAAKQQAADSDAASTSESHNIEQVAAKSAQRVTDAEKRLRDVEAATAKASASSRATLAAQKQELEAELGLAKEIQKTVQSMVTFVGVTGSGGGIGGGLLGQINDLAKTVPEAQHSPQTVQLASPPRPSSAVAPPSRSGSEGMVSLAGEVMSAGSARSQLDELIAESDALIRSMDQLKVPLLTGLRAAIARSDALAEAAASSDVAQLTSGQQEISQLSGRFKQMSTVLVPLGEQQIVVEGTRGLLQQWRNQIQQQDHIASHSLWLRLGALVVAIFFVLVVSDLWRRATLRYVSDTRRRRQFLVLRRILVGFAITIIVVLAFVTEFGSVATYAGFLTAGLALALQNVILSVVAYFFLIGRYGVRAGDRVTISGVTGEVIDLGLVRIYMMELAGTAPDLHPTGRVVVYSNSVLFQPAAIFKQMPGTNYAWRSVALTLAPTTDFQLAERTLTATVNNVFEQYRPAIEQQHAVFERSVDMQFQTPKPECRLRFGNDGLEFSARYPVELKRAREIDEQIMKALYDAIAKEPQLTLSPTGAPKLQAA